MYLIKKNNTFLCDKKISMHVFVYVCKFRWTDVDLTVIVFVTLS